MQTRHPTTRLHKLRAGGEGQIRSQEQPGLQLQAKSRKNVNDAMDRLINWRTDYEMFSQQMYLTMSCVGT